MRGSVPDSVIKSFYHTVLIKTFSFTPPPSLETSKREPPCRDVRGWLLTIRSFNSEGEGSATHYDMGAGAAPATASRSSKTPKGSDFAFSLGLFDEGGAVISEADVRVQVSSEGDYSHTVRPMNHRVLV